MFCCTDLFLPRWLPTLGLLLLTACHGSKPTVFPSPLPTQPSATVREIAERFDVVCPPGPHGARVASVISPRFGLPVFSVPSASFPIELLARGPKPALVAALAAPSLDDQAAQRCLSAAPGSQCVPLVLADVSSTDIAGTGFATLRATATAAGVGVGGWDLVVQSGSDPPERLHRSVWIEPSDPSLPGPLRIVHLSDLHLGKHPGTTDGLLGSLKAAIQRVNAEKPDLVVLTGDVVEDGLQEEWHKRAKTELLAITAPLAIVLGNHDYAHFPKIRSPDKAPDGYFAFSREFHSLRRYGFAYHGWDFIGFDSGPSVFAVRVLTRGVDKETVGWLGQRVEDAANHGRKGVVLFSHAPTRTAPVHAPDSEVSGLCGHMLEGRQQIEQIIETGAERGLRMVHLSGHTHWLELHELRAQARGGEDRWQKRDDGNVCGVVPGGALLLNSPSATQVTFHTVARGNRSGFGVLKLDGDKPVVETLLFDRAGSGGKCSLP